MKDSVSNCGKPCFQYILVSFLGIAIGCLFFVFFYIFDKRQEDFIERRSRLALEYHKKYSRSQARDVIASIRDPRLRGARALAVSEDYVYVVSQLNDTFLTLKISSEGVPQIVSTLKSSILSGASDIALSNNIAFVTCRNSGMLVAVDIANPNAPIIVGSLGGQNLQDATKLEIRGDFAYITAISSNSLTIVDISDPSVMRVANKIQSEQFLYDATGIALNETFAYVTGSQPGIDIFSIIKIAGDKLEVVGSLLDRRLMGAGAVALKSNYAYVAAIDADALTVVCVRDPSKPFVVASVTTGDGYLSPTADIRDIVVKDNLAYTVGRASATFNIFNIANPEAPYLLNSISDAVLLRGARALAIQKNLAFVITYDSGHLVVIRLGNI